MARRVEYAQLESTLDDLSYPVLRHDAAVDLEDVTVVLADDEANLGVLVSETDSDAFRTREELVVALEESVEARTGEERAAGTGDDES